MRIYGTSPLYYYVELVFRCKRMFAAFFLIGLAIASLAAWSRSARYEASILVALSGDPGMAQENIGVNSGPQVTPEKSAAARKADRLAIWLLHTPEFLEKVVLDAKITQNYPGKTTAAMAREVRNNLIGPTVLNDMFMEVKLKWPVPGEAETVLKQIYARYMKQSAVTEALISSSRQKILEQQLVDAASEADRKSRKKFEFLQNPLNYYSKPDMIAANFAKREILIPAISSARIELAEAKSRLSDLSRKLAMTPVQVHQGIEEAPRKVEPIVAAKEELNRLQKDMEDILSVYNSNHPRAVEVINKVNLQKITVADLDTENPRSSEPSVNQVPALNTQSDDLALRQSEMKERVRTIERRAAVLSKELNAVNQRLRAAPQSSVAYAVVEREHKQAELVRQSIEDQLAAARMDARRDKLTQSRSVGMDVQPKAEKVGSGAKIMLLFVLGPFMGIVIAFCLSLVAERLDHTLRTPVEVERYLGKPVLSVIPMLRASRSRKSLRDRTQASIGM